MPARNCPECDGLVSSTINVCPHCGYSFVNVDVIKERNYVNMGTNPYNSLFMSVVTLILFWPCGLVSLIYYFKSDRCWEMGNEEGAKSYGKSSMRWALSIFIILILLFFLVVISFQ